MRDSDAGSRPVSARQQALRESYVSGADILDRVAPRQTNPTVIPPPIPAHERRVQRKQIREAETTRRRVAARPRTNRRRSNYPQLFLRCALGVLVVEAIAALGYSPRLQVRETRVEGNQTVSTARLLSRLNIPAHANIARLPVGKLRQTVLATDPAIESAEIHRRLPGTVRVVIHERTPWASVCAPGGAFYTIDAHFVPFRMGAQPEKGLPRLTIADSGTASPAIVLGKPLNIPGLDRVRKCFGWAAGEPFPLDSVQISPSGQLCLNRVGGMRVELGTQVDLDKKLHSLTVLMQKQPSLRSGAGVAYVTLLSYAAPAVCLTSALPPPAAGKAHGSTEHDSSEGGATVAAPTVPAAQSAIPTVIPAAAPLSSSAPVSTSAPALTSGAPKSEGFQ